MKDSKTEVEPLPKRMRNYQFKKHGDIYSKLLLCKQTDGVKVKNITHKQARSIFVSLQKRTVRVHGRKISLRKSKEVDTYFFHWRQK